MLTRREWLNLTVGASAALTFDRSVLQAQQPLITRAIPSSGEKIPVVGLGSSATFSQVARSEDVTALRDVIRTMVEAGGTVFDTAPSYGGGTSEEVAGRLAKELGMTNKIFWATKVNVGPVMGGGTADPAAARAQIETSFQRIGKRPVDLIQVHNMSNVPTQLGILKEMKKEGWVRYIGVTSTLEQQYGELVTVMRNEPIDFIGIDYAVDNREVEQQILPLAQDRGIAVMVYMPFGRTRLWNRIGDRALPDWAQEFDAKSWAQFMIKYVASHPAVTVVTPATSKARNMADNMGAAVGRLPDEAMRKRMAQFVDALPAAGPQGPQAPPGAQAPGIALSATVLDRYVGEYKAASGFTATFRRDGATLFVKPGTNPEAPLAARSETRFQDPRGPVFEFQLDGQGKVTGAILEQGSQRIPVARIR